MSFDEIVKEVPKLTGEERDALRSYLDQYEAMENDAIDEGLRSLKETNDHLRGIGSQNFGEVWWEVIVTAKALGI